MEPIRHVVTVASSAADAFAVFTAGMGGWWDAAHSPDPPAYAGIEVPTEVGASVVVRHGAQRTPIGKVTAWEPGRHHGDWPDLLARFATACARAA